MRCDSGLSRGKAHERRGTALDVARCSFGEIAQTTSESHNLATPTEAVTMTTTLTASGGKHTCFLQIQCAVGRRGQNSRGLLGSCR